MRLINDLIKFIINNYFINTFVFALFRHSILLFKKYKFVVMRIGNKHRKRLIIIQLRWQTIVNEKFFSSLKY